MHNNNKSLVALCFYNFNNMVFKIIIKKDINNSNEKTQNEIKDKSFICYSHGSFFKMHIVVSNTLLNLYSFFLLC